MRHAHDRLPVGVHAAGKQPRLHERIGYRLFIRAEGRASDPAAGRLSVTLNHGELRQCGQHRLAEASPAKLVGEPVGATLQGADDPAQRLVLGNSDAAIGPSLLVQLPQHVSQQRKCVAAGGLLHHLLHQPGRELQAGALGRLLNHHGQACPAQRLNDQRVVYHLCQPGPLRRCAQELRTHSSDHPHRAVVTERIAKQTQERLLFTHPGAGEKLLGLIDHHQHIGAAINSPSAYSRRRRAGQARPPAQPARHRHAPTPLRHPQRDVAGHGRRRQQPRNGPGYGWAVWSGTNGGNTTQRECQALQAWQQPGSQQRRLAAARGADDGDEATSSALQSRLQQLQQPGDLIVAAKKHGGIIAAEGLQSRVRATGLDPTRRSRSDPTPLVAIQQTIGRMLSHLRPGRSTARR